MRGMLCGKDNSPNQEALVVPDNGQQGIRAGTAGPQRLGGRRAGAVALRQA